MEPTAPSRSEETLRQQAYANIQHKLLHGEIRVGDLVSELALAEEIGMSRTPVREAVGQLELEGLFDKVPRVGTIVRLPSARELSELYEVREALESHAAHHAATALTPRDLGEMERFQAEILTLSDDLQQRGLEVLDEPFLRRYFDADIGFHDLIVRTTDNRRTFKIIHEFRVVQRVFEYDRMSYSHALVQAVAREHGEVLSALRAGDSQGAATALIAHIRSARHHAMESLAQRDSLQEDAAEEATSAKKSAGPKYKRRASRRNPTVLQAA